MSIGKANDNKTQGLINSIYNVVLILVGTIQEENNFQKGSLWYKINKLSVCVFTFDLTTKYLFLGISLSIVDSFI